ncbi:MAG: diguanylate cyclase [Clostridiales bacterium]|nr:diguanylate cyclase [Clostridiales bacterium]
MDKQKSRSGIRQSILLFYITVLFISFFCFGILVYANWTASAKKTTERMAAEVNKGIYDRIYDYIQVPYNNNEINRKLIESKMLDMSDEVQRERFFVETLDLYESGIYSFSYGTVTGEYYGARRNGDGIIEIMRNNEETGGHSWYYSVNEDKTAGDLVVQAGRFDPRTRLWYIAAAETGEGVFSPIYKHFIMNDLTVSAAWPVYNERGDLEGVLGTHLLLTDIGVYLQETVEQYNGKAFILEKDSNRLIANSIGMEDFSVLDDGTLQRYGILDIHDEDIQNAYAQYTSEGPEGAIYTGIRNNYVIDFQELNQNGLDWVVITAIPESYFMADIYKSMLWAAGVLLLSLIVSVFIYSGYTKKRLKPILILLRVSEELSAGDLSKRVDIVRNDEIGLISKSFNSVADKMQSLIENLETTVRERTDELRQANQTAEKSKDDLRLILDSAAEAIYGIDLNGECTFCNRSCLNILGYRTEEELLGKNVHWQIHHTHLDGSQFPIEDCKILRSIQEGKGISVSDEVFWRADDTYLRVEYSAYPQIKDDRVIGAVITFEDITERVKRDEEIKYLNNHDVLTGLYNRRCFEENRSGIDHPDNLPLSVLFADINGLKMTNDIFGHASGDKLIILSAEILKKACRPDDFLARVGGDEFIIFLPKTNREDAELVMNTIKSELSDARVAAIKCSISLGLDIKKDSKQALDEIMANAENEMYRDKTMNRIEINRGIIETIMYSLHDRDPREKQHSIEVSTLCAEMGNAMHLPEAEINKLRRVGYLHDIGKIVIEKDLLSKIPLSDEEFEKVKQHAVVGYRILNLFDDTLDLAEYVYGHHERWDGSGYPRGLKGEQIPFISRIIAVAETYDRVNNRGAQEPNKNTQEAIDVITQGTGTQFDPEIAKIFIQMMRAKNGKNP